MLCVFGVFFLKWQAFQNIDEFTIKILQSESIALLKGKQTHEKKVP
jgi:hypothetical protein